MFQDPEKYVEQLLTMFSKFSLLVADAFYDDPRFLTTRDKAFQDVVNDTCIFKMEMMSSKGKLFVFLNFTFVFEHMPGNFIYIF